MTKQKILEDLTKLNLGDQGRVWLSKATGYSYDYVKNSLAPSAGEPSEKFSKACTRAFSEEERRKSVDVTKSGNSVWDLVYFSGRELNTIDRAKKAGGYDDIYTFYHDAVISYADSLLAAEKVSESEDPPAQHLKVANDPQSYQMNKDRKAK